MADQRPESSASGKKGPGGKNLCLKARMPQLSGDEEIGPEDTRPEGRNDMGTKDSPKGEPTASDNKVDPKDASRDDSKVKAPQQDKK